MSPTPTSTPTSTGGVRTALRVTLAVVSVVTATLLVLVLRQAFPTQPIVASTDDVVPLSEAVYGSARQIRVPGAEVTIRTGRPVEYVDGADVASSYDAGTNAADESPVKPPERLVPPDDGRLVPMTVEISPTADWGVNEDRLPLTLRLVSGEQRITVWTPPVSDQDSVLAPRSFAVALAGQPELSDLIIEVDYDGVVQRLDPATGDVDTGRAQALYEPRTLEADCVGVPSECVFSAASTDQPLRPSYLSFNTTAVSLYPYDADLGWAAEGTVWAATTVQVFAGDAYTASGAPYFVPPSPTRVTMLGSDRTVIDASLNEMTTTSMSYGRVVFALPTDVEPSALVLRRQAAPEGTTRRVPLVARVPLT